MAEQPFDTGPRDPLADLQLARDAWAGPGRTALDATLDAIAAPLARSFLLEQPNVAGMGVAAWGLSTVDATGPDPEAAARRMLGGRGPLADLMRDRAPAKADPTDDPEALQRGADLLDALDRLETAAQDLSDDAPPAVLERVERLRTALRKRLKHEARLSSRLRRHLDEAEDDADAAARLRAAVQPPDTPDVDASDGGAPVRIPRPVPTDDPYGEALDTALAREPAPPEAELSALRSRIARTVERALRAPADSPQSRRAVEQARRLMASEVAATGGALALDASQDGVDTAALRRALAGRASATPRPDADGGHRPATGLTEVPILSSRGPKARVIGYLAAGERIAGQVKDGFLRVDAPGRKDRGWIRAEHVDDAPPEPATWPGPLGAPGVGPATSGAGGRGRPSAELARFAALVASHTGRPLSEVMAELDRPVVTESGYSPDESKKAPRRARGAAAAARSTPSTAPISIESVTVDGLGGPDAAEAAAVLNAALAALPRVLDARLRGDPERVRRLRADGGRTGEVPVDVRVPTGGGDVNARGQVLAGDMADAVIRSGAARIGVLRLGVSTVGEPDRDPARLFEKLARGADDEVVDALAAERKGLDGAVQGRLARFFGHDFQDVMLFAGPMAGVLARSIQAEAFTHGKMVFFDPGAYRLDSAAGEALLAHELTHTRQDDGRGVRQKEAEALVTEAAYLDWLQPGGAPLAFDDVQLEAARAADAPGGAMRARRDRSTMGAEGGPRLDTARMEERVEQVLEVVRQKLSGGDDIEAQRIGRLATDGFDNRGS